MITTILPQRHSTTEHPIPQFISYTPSNRIPQHHPPLIKRRLTTAGISAERVIYHDAEIPIIHQSSHPSIHNTHFPRNIIRTWQNMISYPLLKAETKRNEIGVPVPYHRTTYHESSSRHSSVLAYFLSKGRSE